MIPTEIVDHIFSLLRSDQDYKTLEVCSIVFPQIVDRHLYSHLTFYVPSSTSSEDRVPSGTINDKGTYTIDPSKFFLVFIDRPHVANYVRDVRIIMIIDYGCSESSISPVISSILSNLSELESIALSTNSPLSWHTFDPTFCRAFQNIIQLPSIKAVSISNVNGFSLKAFDNCKNLRYLLLHGTFADAKDACTTSYPRLSSLCVDSQTDLTRIISWATSNTFRTLSLRTRRRMGLVPFRSLIEACSSTLVRLEFDHGYCVNQREYSTHSVFQGLRLPHLQQIIVCSPIVVPYSGQYFSSLPFLAPFLMSVPSMSSALHLCLQLQFHIRTISPFLNMDWSNVADFLILPVFRHPIEIYISATVQQDTSGSVLLAEVVSSFKQNAEMKRLLEDGKLVVALGSEQ